jgi:hypothetical protein
MAKTSAANAATEAAASSAPENKEAKERLWRAIRDCTFMGKRYRAGETVLAAKNDNPHFEKVTP